MDEIKEQILNNETTRNRMTEWFTLTGEVIADLSAIDVEPATTLKFLKTLLSPKNLKLFE